MKKRIDARKELERTRTRLSEWEAAAEKAARDIERYRRPDLVKKAERRGKMAERKLQEYAKRERDLTQRIARKDRQKTKQERGPGKWIYHPKTSYLRSSHEVTVEVSFHRKDFGRMSTEEVQDALHSLVKGRHPEHIVVTGVMYGKLEASKRGKRSDIVAFIGAVLSGVLETIGEEKVK